MDFTNTMFVTEEYYNKLDNKRKPQKNDVLYSVVGSFGKPVFVKEDEKFVFQRHIAILRPNKERVNPMFMYYTMLSKDFYHKADAVALGAAQRTISLTSLRNMEIALPPRSVQVSIATTLSRYDALIANYQRQIKLLEEAAQRLYKEWFVDLRFPGHESVKVTDGVPEGWEKKKLGDVADVNREKIGKDFNGEINYIDLSSTKSGRIIARQKYNFSNAPGRARRIAHDGDMVWGMVRPNLKPYALVMNPYENDAFSTGFAVLTAIDVPFTYLYLMTTTDSFIKYLVNCTNGAAYPAVKPVHFAEAECNIPPKALLSQFHNIVEPMVRKISLLDTQLSLLTESRDRLLPKLMSGEIEL